MKTKADLNRNHAVEFLGSAAAPAAVRRALAPNPGAPGRTKQWLGFTRPVWAARARPTAPEAGALPIPTASFRLKDRFVSIMAGGRGERFRALRREKATLTGGPVSDKFQP